MAVIRIAEGTQSATVGTEHTLWEDLQASGTYQFVVDLVNMASGDSVTLRVYRYTDDAGPYKLAYYWTFTDAQPAPVAISVPVMTTMALRLTLQQTAGTGRSFKWVVERA